MVSIIMGLWKVKCFFFFLSGQIKRMNANTKKWRVGSQINS